MDKLILIGLLGGGVWLASKKKTKAAKLPRVLVPKDPSDDDDLVDPVDPTDPTAPRIYLDVRVSDPTMMMNPHVYVEEHGKPSAKHNNIFYVDPGSVVVVSLSNDLELSAKGVFVGGNAKDLGSTKRDIAVNIGTGSLEIPVITVPSWPEPTTGTAMIFVKK